MNPFTGAQDVADLESVISTAELSRRPSRAPDHAAENRALVALAQGMATSPNGILQKLAETALTLCRAHSAGVSLLESDGKHFYWPAITGQWASHVGGGTPREFGPCGTVLDRNAAQLMSHVERHFTYFAPVTPWIEEVLLIPFYVEGKAVGTIWVIVHDQSRRFDGEDLRVMTNLGTFAAAAYQTLQSLNATNQAHRELQQTASVLRQRAAQFQALFDEAPLGVYLIDANFRITQVNPKALPVFGDIPDLIGRDFEEVIRILWPTPYADEIVQRFRHTSATGEPYVVPERCEERRDRKVREYYEWEIHRIPLPEGGYGVVCYFNDISAHVLVREELRESEQRLQTERERLKQFQIELQEKIADLEKFHDVVVGRELKLVEMENDNQDMRSRLKDLELKLSALAAERSK
jgi:PAS domain S-box-containing protein